MSTNHNLKFKCERYRDIDGVLLLDKPKSITSNAALQNIKRLFRARKAGHSGSLDPIASGLLPICFGEATKFSRFLLEADKRYQATAILGIRTDSGDEEGRVLSNRSISSISLSLIEEILQQFRGDIFQVPSMYSAIKHQGQPLYKFARLGINIERPKRPISVSLLKILNYRDNILSLEVHVSKGTYIRTLIDDIGEALGCGAHVVELRRFGVGSYQSSEMYSMDVLENALQEGGIESLDSYLLPVDGAVIKLPSVILSEVTAYYLMQGQPVLIPYAPMAGLVRLMLNDNQFLGIGEILEDGRVAPRRLIRCALKKGDSL